MRSSLLQKNQLTVNKAFVYSPNKGDVVKETKTASGEREILCPLTVMKLLKKVVARYHELKLKGGKKFKDSRFLFCYDDGTSIGASNLSSRYERFVKRHSDEIRYLSLHKLRHTYASICIADGMDIKSVQETLGHSDAMMTLNTYSHAYEQKKKEQAELLEKKCLEVLYRLFVSHVLLLLIQWGQDF